MGSSPTIFLHINGKRLAIALKYEPTTLADLRDYLKKEGHMTDNDRFILFRYKSKLPVTDKHVPYEVEPECERSIPTSALYEFGDPYAGVIRPRSKKVVRDMQIAPAPCKA
ncbi:hypothetical protein SDRG_04582 [Saprolegnia diclina VS20]|uniref:Uncharacterized protein n=1 Tax=Saprolegnia diclina (strain VS20) TaxID=1156394 RepID=T0RZZ2_SAPDV|nr:hypothetical protein SDRG_04582 [Saprolegnia diclina VS20]EQC38153.1 hypothetical protein SDRG_04582 [Saprolegnia diclina VS20]|eukprot:XP_008608480.1 hypothetical protein SDRG_04582 [Saprolegnia diclina VS20]